MKESKKMVQIKNDAFVMGYLACIQNLICVDRIAKDRCVELILEGGFERKEYIKAQKLSGFMGDEIKEILKLAFGK